MTKKELYQALYTVLDNGKENEVFLKTNDIRNKTLKTLLGVEEEKLSNQIELYNKIQKAREEFGNEDANITGTSKFDDIVEYWKAIHHLYVCYLVKLEESLVGNKTINKILIYEAPPMPNSDEKPEKFGKINYILAQSCKYCKINSDLFTTTPNGAYSNTIKSLEKNGGDQNIREILVEQGILFIDLCPLPLPMTSDIRKDKWGENFVDDKPLTVVLLELALKFALEKGIKISEKPIIAMGTPAATSQSIYLYFEKMIFEKMIKEDKYRNPCISIEVEKNGKIEVSKIDFSTLLNINRKYDSKNQILPLYQSNIISGSNTPNPELLKRIF
jgi:hypothetical protein